MKKTLFWVIACIYFIVYVWLMKTLSLWGSTYIVFFAFMAFIPLIPFLAPFAVSAYTSPNVRAASEPKGFLRWL